MYKYKTLHTNKRNSCKIKIKVCCFELIVFSSDKVDMQIASKVFAPIMKSHIGHIDRSTQSEPATHTHTIHTNSANFATKPTNR